MGDVRAAAVGLLQRQDRAQVGVRQLAAGGVLADLLGEGQRDVRAGVVGARPVGRAERRRREVVVFNSAGGCVSVGHRQRRAGHC